MTLDETGKSRRSVCTSAEYDKFALVVDVFSNAGFSLFRVILGELQRIETQLDYGRFSNFKSTCDGHSIKIGPQMDIMNAMALANNMAIESKTNWSFTYEYNHMGDASVHLQVQDDNAAVLLKMTV